MLGRVLVIVAKKTQGRRKRPGPAAPVLARPVFRVTGTKCVAAAAAYKQCFAAALVYGSSSSRLLVWFVVDGRAANIF